MKANEILKAATMFARVKEMLLTTDETAAKFVELALASGANNVDNFYLGY